MCIIKEIKHQFSIKGRIGTWKKHHGFVPGQDAALHTHQNFDHEGWAAEWGIANQKSLYSNRNLTNLSDNPERMGVTAQFSSFSIKDSMCHAPVN
jgi:hypothetical protein